MIFRISLICVLLTASGLVGGCLDRASTKTNSPKPKPTKPITTTDASKKKVSRDPARTLPIEELAGELVMTKLVGAQATSTELDAIRSLQLGGVILFSWNVVDQAQLLKLTRSLTAARAPAARRAGLPINMLVSVDQEGGAIRNVPFAPPEENQQIIASSSTRHAVQVGKATGEALVSVGVSMDLGPVADLAQPPNHTMASRAFSDDPQVAGRFVEATVRGLQESGVSAVVKHFPGFGASTANSDQDIAFVDRSRAELLKHELVPFRRAFQAGVDVVMVSHAVHRTLGSTMPGTIDPKISMSLLRDQLGYDGVAMTDSMNARGFRNVWNDTVPRACPRAISAGIDLVLLTGSLETARLCRARIVDALHEGTLSEERFREAASRVIALRQRHSIQ